MNVLLIAASLTLLAVIAWQNYRYPQLRQLTISDGLYSIVPDHWLLDGAYVFLAIALYLRLPCLLTAGAGIALLVTAVSNTFAAWIDVLTNGVHNKIHTVATVVMFLLVLTLEAVQDHGWMWGLSLAGVALPALSIGLLRFQKAIAPGPFAEKLAVLLLCSWLIVWA